MFVGHARGLEVRSVVDPPGLGRGFQGLERLGSHRLGDRMHTDVVGTVKRILVGRHFDAGLGERRSNALVMGDQEDAADVEDDGAYR